MRLPLSSLPALPGPLAFAAGAVLFLALFAGLQAHAACERAHRVPVHHAPCLDGGLGRPGAAQRLVWARNTCSDLGTVVAKWDIAGLPDRTWHLRDSRERSERIPSVGLRGLYCCLDLGPCHRLDRAAPPGPYTDDEAGCVRQWERSGASKRCDLLSAAFHRGAHRWCRLRARCDTAERPGGSRTVGAERSVKIQRVDELKWCPQRRPQTALVYHTRC